MTPKPGIYPGVPFDEYLTWDAVSNSVLKVLQDKSPMHAKYYQEHPPEPTKALVVGSAAHCMALEPEAFKERYAVSPTVDRRTKEGKEQWAHFEQAVNGKVILTTDQFLVVSAVADSIKNQAVYRFICKGEAEVCVVWTDKETGLLCKARLDYVHQGRAIIIDLKSTTDASKRAFLYSIWKYRYYQQAAFYSYGWKAATGDDNCFVFLPVEKSPPYAVAAFEVHDNLIAAGRKQYRQALETYAECRANDKWPGYGDTVELIDLTEWMLKESGFSKYEITEDE